MICAVCPGAARKPSPCQPVPPTTTPFVPIADDSQPM
jgi:hypothetical protein